MKLRPTNVASTGVLAALAMTTVLALPGRADAAPVDDDYEHEYEVAHAIADAFEAGHAKALRFATTTQLEAIQYASKSELEAALRAYVDVAHERGIHGLEGTLVSTAAALGGVDFAGFVAAREMLSELADTVEVEEHPRPNALLPMVRAGSPLVHYVPAALAGTVLATQAATGVLDLESAMQDAWCTPGALEAFEARWGSELGAMMQALCDQGEGGQGGGGGGGMGGDLGLGYGGEVSLLDCLMSHQETRAERVTGLMMACAESMLEGGGGNPLADSYPYGGGSTFDWVFPLPETPYSTTTTKTDQNGTEHVTSESFYTSPPDDGGQLVYEVRYNDDGSTTTSYANGAGITAMEVTRNADGEITHTSYNDPSGAPLREETRNSDGTSHTTDHGPDGSRLETDYDADGNIVSQQEYDADGEPVPPPAPGESGSELGSEFATTAECRALTLELLEMSDALALIEAGAIDPRTVNPNPEGEVEPSSDLDCLSLSGGALVDASFECRESLMLCNGGFMLDAGCNCRSAPTGAKPSRQCGIYMRCADGGSSEYRDGACRCGDGVDPIVDGGTAPEPRPAPVDRRGGRPVDPM